MTNISILLSSIEYDMVKDILLDYIVLLNETNKESNVINVATQSQISDARYLLERLAHATN